MKVVIILCYFVFGLLHGSVFYQWIDLELILSTHAILKNEYYSLENKNDNSLELYPKQDEVIVSLKDIQVATSSVEEPEMADEQVLTESVSSDNVSQDRESQDYDILKTNHKSDWNLILVNKQHPIPDQYEVKVGNLSKGMKCDVRVIAKIREMLENAQQDGIILSIKSPYRNDQRQTYLFNKKVKTNMKQKMSYLEAYKESAQAVTLPGASEHQIGLAFDIVSNQYSLLEEEFAQTEAGNWLSEHSHEYGFILRYPKGKEDITGIEFEPWHFRYVGVEAATYMYNNNLTLEEFVSMLPLEIE